MCIHEIITIKMPVNIFACHILLSLMEVSTRILNFLTQAYFFLFLFSITGAFYMYRTKIGDLKKSFHFAIKTTRVLVMLASYLLFVKSKKMITLTLCQSPLQ